MKNSPYSKEPQSTRVRSLEIRKTEKQKAELFAIVDWVFRGEGLAAIRVLLR